MKINVKRLSLILAFSLLFCLGACHRNNDVTFVVYTQHDKPCADDTTHTVTGVDFNLNLTLLQSDSRKLPIGALNRQLLQLALGYSGDDANQAMLHFCDSLRAEQREWQADMDSNGDLFVDLNRWEISVDLYPDKFEDNLLTYVLTGEGFMGGAHGYSYNQYYLFNLSMGKLLTEEDIFEMNTANQAQLETLLHDAFMEAYASVDTVIDTLSIDTVADHLSIQEELDRVEDLLQNVDFSHLRPNGNFRVLDQSLVYHFNAYDIAPYAYGAFDVEIPSYQLHDMLKKDSPLYRYWFKK